MRLVLTIAGAACAAMGGLWFLQGAGIVHWPASSFMLDQRIWMLWGGLLALLGVGLIWRSRRR
jgi:LPXTG-motif cell wall-anchored protein